MTSEAARPGNTAATGRLFEKHLGDVIALVLVLVIVLYSASGPLRELVRRYLESPTAAFDQMSRRDQRVFLREHWLGAGIRTFEQSFRTPTGLIIGLPIVLSFIVFGAVLVACGAGRS